MLLQVLQEDCGVVYNPERKFNPAPGTPADDFVYGILDKNGPGGTCVTMPVVYVAVSRRLGFPVWLVETREHLLCRWDDPHGTVIRWENPETSFWIPPDRFNVEGAGEGIGYFPDDYYKQRPHPWTKVDVVHDRYLRSMTAREEFAGFLIARGECFWDLKNREEALKAYYFACQLVPDDIRYRWLHEKRSAECERYLADHRRSIDEVSERNRRNAAEREKQRQARPIFPPKPVKIAFGSPYPSYLPFGTPVRYVPPEEADVMLPVGRSLRVALGKPVPRNLPPGTTIQYVAPELADPLPPEYEEDFG